MRKESGTGAELDRMSIALSETGASSRDAILEEWMFLAMLTSMDDVAVLWQEDWGD